MEKRQKYMRPKKQCYEETMLRVFKVINLTEMMSTPPQP